MNDLQSLIIGAVARHIAGWLAAWLVAHGLLAQGDSVSWTQMTVGILIGAASLGWSLWQKQGHAIIAAQAEKLKSQLQYHGGPKT